ncbi:MAG: DNA polymerase III subunit delta' [Gammaproteobacteria bacterium]|nr:DNA polymerase III subunit delta' [Gammaproteobacteria bacterium]MCP5137169.1 DNA polymerase III subunit delta' [Gammaproteobacteria bacterium]
MTQALPAWLCAPLDALRAQRDVGRLHHALLIHGPRGVGKALLAEHLIRGLFCKTPDAQGHACGECAPCKLYLAGNHPDARLVEPEIEHRQFAPYLHAIAQDDPDRKADTPRKQRLISIGQIRQLNEFLVTKSQFGGWRIGVIAPAEAMNVNAANSLLKTLEEPGGSTLLMLLSERPSALPATVRSRCRSLSIPAPAHAEAGAWLRSLHPQGDTEQALALSGGAPLAAAAMLDDGRLELHGQALSELEQLLRGRVEPISLAEQWSKVGAPIYIGFLQSWLVDMIRMHSGAGVPSAALARRLQALAQGLDLRELYRRLDAVSEARRLLDRSISLQALLEDLLLGWMPTPRRR